VQARSLFDYKNLLVTRLDDEQPRFLTPAPEHLGMRRLLAGVGGRSSDRGCSRFGLNGATCGLVSAGRMKENYGMEIRGRVQNGVVVLDGEIPLPEGATVTVCYPVPLPAGQPNSRRRVLLPLVRSDHPGSRRLTADRLAAILEDDDVSA